MWIKYRKQIVQWVLAVVIGTLILNCIVACYELSPGLPHRAGGATEVIHVPNSVIVNSDEGRSISRVDGNGYINASDDLADSGYVLVMGNSQSNGIHVNEDKRYISLLSEKLRIDDSDSKVFAYNVSHDGQDFCDLVSGFTAALQEFPNSRAVVLQISIDWTLDKMRSCTVQRPFSEEMRGSYIGTHLSDGQKLRHLIRIGFPFPVYLREKLLKIEWDFDDAFWYSEEAVVTENAENEDRWNEYAECLDEVLKFLRSNYTGDIVILELPSVSFMGEGMLQSNNGIRQELFDKLCLENDIIYVNMYDTYCTEYEAHHVLPYGFSNTRPGSGHLNEAGHQMIADELYPILEGSME